MDDAYMQGRAADVKDVSDRLLGILSDAGESGVVADEPVIVAADDLVPSEMFSLTSPKCLHLQPCTDQQIPIRQSLQGP